MTITHHRRSGWLVHMRRTPQLNVWGTFCFLFGFLVAPCLHTYGHRADHVHDGGSIRYFELGEDHPHPHPHAPPSTERASAGESAPSHGHGALAHFGLAVPGGAIFAVVAPAAPLVLLPAILPTWPLPGPPCGVALARGPPRA
jgi:hypothetical protein